MMAARVFPDAKPAKDTGLRWRVLTEARNWLGTPYRHQASLQGVGCDCLGLLRGIWRALYGAEPQAVPAYSADWAETGCRETLIDAGSRWLVVSNLENAAPGDVLVFRWRDSCPAKHVGILSRPFGDRPCIIHSYERAGVIESSLVPAWQRRIAAVFAFPEMT